jgi:hypothetical protein
MDAVRKKELKAAFRSDERQRAIDELPALLGTMTEFLDIMEERVEDCDHSLRIARRCMAELELEPDDVIPWLESYGGYCDCEIVMNVRDGCAAFR